jgi:uncharacterized protein YjdB
MTSAPRSLHLALGVGLLWPGLAAAQVALANPSQPFRLRGDMGAVSELYQVYGADPRRPWGTQQFLLNPSMTLMGSLDLSVNLLVSTDQGSDVGLHGLPGRQRLNEFGLHPTWSWGRAHVGTFSETYSARTYAGLRIRGGGVELNPGLLRFGVFGGSAQSPVFGGLTSGGFARRAVGGRIGLGRDNGNAYASFLQVMVVRTWDDETSLPSPTDSGAPVLPPDVPANPYAVTPEENFVVGLAGGIGLFAGKLYLKGEIDGAVHTRDRRADPIAEEELSGYPDVLKGIMTPRLGTHGDYAYSTEATLRLPTLPGATRSAPRTLTATVGYQYSGPGYVSLGTPSLFNDYRKVDARAAVRLGSSQIRLDGLTQRDNVLGQKSATTTRNRLGGMYTIQATRRWTSAITLRWLGMDNDAMDSLRRVAYANWSVGTTQFLPEGSPRRHDRAHLCAPARRRRQPGARGLHAPVPHRGRPRDRPPRGTDPGDARAGRAAGAGRRGAVVHACHVRARGPVAVSGSRLDVHRNGDVGPVLRRHGRAPRRPHHPLAHHAGRHAVAHAPEQPLLGRPVRARHLRRAPHEPAMVAHLLSHRLGRARRWALVALAGSACLTPTDPNAGRVAELKVRAAFAPGAEPDAMGVTVDSATVLATPLDGGPTVVDTAVPLTDLEATLSWIVDLAADSAPYTVRLELRGGERRLYTGENQVQLNRLPLGDAPVHDVTVAYVGPGAVATVTVTPGAVTLTATGAVQQFTAEAHDGDGTPVATTFAWSTSDAAVAAVDPATGEATAVATGAATITATASGITGDATVTVAVGGLFVEIAPTSATIPALNATRLFTATARDADGTVIEDAVFAWATGNPAIATVDDAGLATALAEGATTVSAEAGVVTGTADLQVTVVTTVEVSPTTATLTALGATQAFSAVARDANGDPVSSVAFVWTSSNTAAASVDPASGVATAMANGTTTITATAGAASGSASLTVAQTITSLEVTPASATLTALGTTQQFTAVARDGNGNPVATAVEWSTSDDEVATVDPATGLATAVATGEVTITAQAGGLSATAQLLVAPGGLSVEVTPATATLTSLGATQQFTAVARDGDGTPIADPTFAWTARNPAVLTVDATGLATAVAEGTTWVVAALGDEADSAAVRVAVATSVEVAPAAATLAAFGATQPFTGTARDAGGAAIPGVTFAWTSSDPTIAIVDPLTGVATAVANGTVTITAQAGGASGNATLTVAQAVAGIAVTPGSVTLAALDATQQFSATALDANGNAVTRPVTVGWTSTDPAVAIVNPASGLATAVANGTVGILATAEGATGGASLTVDQFVVTADVAPPTATLVSLGATQRFSATGRDANSNLVADAAFAWESDDPTIATVDPATGLATAVGAGSTAIRARDADGAAGQATLTVAPEVVSVEVQPAAATLEALGATRQFVAVARDAGGSVIQDVAWTWTTDEPVAEVEETGLTTALANGTTQVIATAPNGVFGSATLVVAQRITSVEVTPATATLIALGTTQAFGAVARDANGNEVTGTTFTWASANTATATVDPASGVATAVANGTVTITATADGVTGTASLTVAQIVASIEVTPAEATIVGAGTTQHFTATARDASGYVVAGTAFVWTTSDSLVATIDGNGIATAVATGLVAITARSGAVNGTAVLNVCVPTGAPPAGVGGSTGVC